MSWDTYRTQRENLRDAILKKKARIVEIESILKRAPITEYRGRAVHGGEGWRLRLGEDRQHLLIAVEELEGELERLGQAGRTPHVAHADSAQEQSAGLFPEIEDVATTSRDFLCTGQTPSALSLDRFSRSLRGFRGCIAINKEPSSHHRVVNN
jgi:hypothetical protein